MFDLGEGKRDRKKLNITTFPDIIFYTTISYIILIGLFLYPPLRQNILNSFPAPLPPSDQALLETRLLFFISFLTGLSLVISFSVVLFLQWITKAIMEKKEYDKTMTQGMLLFGKGFLYVGIALGLTLTWLISRNIFNNMLSINGIATISSWIVEAFLFIIMMSFVSFTMTTTLALFFFNLFLIIFGSRK